MDTKDEEARRLADSHYEVEPGISQIYRVTTSEELEAMDEEPIKLLEVNEFTIPSGIMPLKFGPLPSRGIHFRSIIIEVTPEEFRKIRTRELTLPAGWSVGELLPRPVVNGSV
jgi:hypothetical protein